MLELRELLLSEFVDIGRPAQRVEKNITHNAAFIQKLIQQETIHNYSNCENEARGKQKRVKQFVLLIAGTLWKLH